MQRRDWLIVAGIILLVALALLLPNLVLSRGAPAAPAVVESAETEAASPTVAAPALDDVGSTPTEPAPTPPSTPAPTDNAETDDAAPSDLETSDTASTEEMEDTGGGDSAGAEGSPSDNSLAAIDAPDGGNAFAVGDYAAYSDPNGRFEIRYPDAWLVVANEEVSPGNVNFVDIKVESPETWAYVNVAYAPIPNLADFVSAMQQSFAQQTGVENFRVREEQSTTINGLPAVEQTMRFEMGDIAVAQRTLYVQSDGAAFVLSLIVPEASFEAYQLTFESMAASFTPAGLAR